MRKKERRVAETTVKAEFAKSAPTAGGVAPTEVRSAAAAAQVSGMVDPSYG